MAMATSKDIKQITISLTDRDIKELKDVGNFSVYAGNTIIVLNVHRT